MMELIDYLKQERPGIHEEYLRKITPHYYESGVLYHPITNGFGCGHEGSNQPLEIVSGDYMRNGEIQMTLQSKWNGQQRYGVNLSEAHRKIKRIDDSVLPVGNPIPNSKRFIYLNINGVDYDIHQGYWRDYHSKRLGGRIWVTPSNGKITKVYGQEKQEYYELYSVIGKGSWNLKHVKSYDSVGRENYDIKFGISAKEFKRIVFGNPDIKLKCQLFDDYGNKPK